MAGVWPGLHNFRRHSCRAAKSVQDFEHLVQRGRIKAIRNFDETVLHIFSREVLQRIKDGDAVWETMVPQEIAAIIKARQLFGYREAHEDNAGVTV